jgi:hypothetical protein
MMVTSIVRSYLPRPSVSGITRLSRPVRFRRLNRAEAHVLRVRVLAVSRHISDTSARNAGPLPAHELRPRERARIVDDIAGRIDAPLHGAHELPVEREIQLGLVALKPRSDPFGDGTRWVVRRLFRANS